MNLSSLKEGMLLKPNSGLFFNRYLVQFELSVSDVTYIPWIEINKSTGNRHYGRNAPLIDVPSDDELIMYLGTMFRKNVFSLKDSLLREYHIILWRGLVCRFDVSKDLKHFKKL